MNTDYAAAEPARAEVDALAGPTLLEFGSSTCGHCRRAQPHIAQAADQRRRGACPQICPRAQSGSGCARMKILVECHAGYRGEEEPRAFTMGATRLAILEILDRWAAPEHRYFKVKVDDGRTLLLRHDSASGQWELAGLVGAERPPDPGATKLH